MLTIRLKCQIENIATLENNRLLPLLLRSFFFLLKKRTNPADKACPKGRHFIDIKAQQ